MSAARKVGAAVPAVRKSAPPRTLVALEKRIVTCVLCPRLREYCAQVATLKRRAYRGETYWGKPVPGFGDPAARLLLVGLAPGAHGANRTGRMFTGDASGDWLFAALHAAGFANQPTSTARGDGLKLQGVWIAAAGRCAPPDNKPQPAELAACRVHLQSELAMLAHVRIVLALGRIGHEAYLRASGWWDRMAPRERPAFAHGAEATLPDGIVLASTFHPSRQNTQTGRLTSAMWQAVFARMRAHVEKLPPPPRPR